MLSGHRCPLWWKCPESHCARHIHQIHVCKCTPYVLNIRWTRTWKHMASNCVVVFHFPSVCVLMSISAAYVTIGSYISCMSTNYTFAIVYKGRHTKEMSVIDEPAHVAVRLQLLEMSSITTPNQTISNVCTRYNILRAFFLGKILAIFTDMRQWKNSVR